MLFAASLLAGCAAETTSDSTTSAPASEHLSTAVSAQSELVVLAEFEFSYDAVTGEHRLEFQPPTQAEYVSADGTVRQAVGFCNDFGVNIGSSGDFRIDTIIDSIGTTAAECLSAAEIADWGTLYYNEGGAFCATVRVQNQSGVTIGNVTAEISEITTGYEGYEYIETPDGTEPCCGTGADVSAFTGQNAPSDISGGAFLHGDLADGAFADQQWTFRNAGGAFTFGGRLVGSIQELENGRDDDCDGRIDNAVGIYAENDDCIENADCASGLCEDIDPETSIGLCAESCEAGAYGPDCLDCPGGPDSVCSSNGTCDDGAGGGGTCECDAGWGGTACDECATDFFGASCTACPDCGADGACNDGLAGDGTCACDAGFHGTLCEFSCADGTQNGDEEGLDCGGAECDACGTGGAPVIDCGANGASVAGTVVYNGGPSVPCDQISDDVCLTRSSGGGPFFNAETESRYGSGSPSGTEWALGTCDAPGSFDDFLDTVGYCPPCDIPGDFCMRETATGTETDINFVHWQSGGGGGFGYTRFGSVCQCDAGYHGSRCEFSCSDGIQNGDEAAIDCGGDTCAACPPGAECNFRGTAGPTTVSYTHVAGDCDPIGDGVCITRGSSAQIYNSAFESSADDHTPTGTLWARGTCDSPTTGFSGFVDAVRWCPPCYIPGDFCVRLTADGSEYDVDFTSWQAGGGGGFAYTRTGIGCVCDAPYVGARCEASCVDGLLNGDETGVDCGGSCATACADGVACEDASDCVSNYCHPVDDVCATPSCTDGLMNGDEENIDCGLAACGEACGDVGFGCADHQLGNLTGLNILTGDTSTEANEIQATCAHYQNGGDFTVNWTPPATGSYEFTLDGSSYDSAINIRSAAAGPICTNDAPEIACQDDSGDLQPNLIFSVTEGTWYLIVIDGYSSSSGAFTFSILPRTL